MITMVYLRVELMVEGKEKETRKAERKRSKIERKDGRKEQK